MNPRRAFSVGVFPRLRGRILLIEHKRLQCWLPPGGEIDDGETPLEAAARELHEETGLRGSFVNISPVEGAPAGWIGYEEHMAGSKGLHMNFVFVADVETDRVAPNDEFEHYRWTDSTAGLECPPNVRQLFNIAKNAGRDPAAVARQWIIKFNERDLEGLLNLYSEDAVHVSPKLRARRPETGGRVRGRAALRDWYLDAFARLPHLKYIEKHISVSEGRAVLEYERVNPGEENMMVAEVYSIMDGKIIESFVYHG